MSLVRKTTESLSSNDKVIHYLHGSTKNCVTLLEKTSPENLFPVQQHRSRLTSEYDSLSSSSSSSIVDSVSRSDTSLESSLSDPIVHSSLISSNTSSDEDFDFNIGFEQNTESGDDDEQHTFNKNNADALTLLGESMVDEYLRQLSNSTVFNDDYDSIESDAVTEYYNKQQRRASFLYDSTHTLCSSDRFSAYTEDDQDTEQSTGCPLRSHSLSIFPIDNQSTFVDKAPKKIVRFADMMGLDLESIRYMTPPDQTATSVLQECVRLQFGQFRTSKHQLDLPDIRKRTSSTTSLPSPTRNYNLVSKNFTSPININPLIYEKQVLLECLHTKDATAYATIRVHNCAYQKTVFARLTQDEWETSNDIPASHSMSYTHDNTDTFTFQITLSKAIDSIEGSKRILFAVCLKAIGEEFWDNNQGWNYVLDILEKR